VENQHPITPPPKLIERWFDACVLEVQGATVYEDFKEFKFATLAAQWGADQELEACCEWFTSKFGAEVKADIADLRAARRPKPPSLKRVALLQLDVITKDLAMHGLGCDLSQIRRALESIPDHTSEGD
jgi:hypothetical protein